MSAFRVRITFVILLLLLLFSLYLGCRIGAVGIDNEAFWRLLSGGATASDQAVGQILLHIRLPRVFAAALVGGILAVTGAVMQGLFRNPLVDPGIVGVMAGASFAATLSIVLGGALFPAFFNATNDYALPLAAFLGGWAVTMLLYTLANRGGVINIATMLLIGIALGALTGALTGLLTYLADDKQLRSITFWGMGSLAIFDWHKLAILAVVCLLTLPLLLRDAHILNALMLGEKVAGHLGFNTESAKKRQILLVALLVGGCVAFSGGIGFVGLVVPHIVRGLLGSNHRLVLPASFLFGAALLNFSDLIARTIVSPAELPIGILTAMIGAPFLGFLVWKGAKR
ncbi:MAG: Fe3+-siderophore ABC transporter permease [Gammaproteobacteria bacterium]|nr:MAG: Fe3+-siderophore ABC transporter permease [Gammaproteobacteria bacterium]